jgi:hypothetical protein
VKDGGRVVSCLLSRSTHLLDVIRPSVVLCWNACTQVPRRAYSQNLHFMSAVKTGCTPDVNMPACIQVACRFRSWFAAVPLITHGGSCPPVPSSACQSQTEVWGSHIPGGTVTHSFPRPAATVRLRSVGCLVPVAPKKGINELVGHGYVQYVEFFHDSPPQHAGLTAATPGLSTADCRL